MSSVGLESCVHTVTLTKKDTQMETWNLLKSTVYLVKT